jgi:acetyltransferase
VLAASPGVIAVDARVSVAPVTRSAHAPPGHPRFAIRPYPKEWERRLTLNNGTAVLVRPVRPEDEALFREFFENVTQEDLRLRFFAPLKDFSHLFIARLTQIDYGRAMAFVAIDEASGKMLGGARLHANADYDRGEYAILVRSDLKGRGLGWLLMQLLIEYARAEGIRTIEGQVLSENTTMLKMCKELGFALSHDPEDPAVCDARLSLS